MCRSGLGGGDRSRRVDLGHAEWVCVCVCIKSAVDKDTCINGGDFVEICKCSF